MSKVVDLSLFNNQWYNSGAGKLKGILWYITNAFIFQRSWMPIYSIKTALLRLFGAQVGVGVVIKPKVNIKYPWKLSIGNNTWIGEGVWIDNLASVRLGNNVCISQGALLLCGNHNYSTEAFDLITKEIEIEDGAWIGAKSVVCPGVHVGSHAVLTVGSVATTNLCEFGIYQGVPAQKKKERQIK